MSIRLPIVLSMAISGCTVDRFIESGTPFVLDASVLLDGGEVLEFPASVALNVTKLSAPADGSCEASIQVDAGGGGVSHTADILLVFAGAELTLGATTTFVDNDNNPHDLGFPMTDGTWRAYRAGTATVTDLQDDVLELAFENGELCITEFESDTLALTDCEPSSVVVRLSHPAQDSIGVEDRCLDGAAWDISGFAPLCWPEYSPRSSCP